MGRDSTACRLGSSGRGPGNPHPFGYSATDANVTTPLSVTAIRTIIKEALLVDRRPGNVRLRSKATWIQGAPASGPVSDRVGTQP